MCAYYYTNLKSVLVLSKTCESLTTVVQTPNKHCYNEFLSITKLESASVQCTVIERSVGCNKALM